MKLLRILIIPFFIFGNCIQIEDSTFDPNSPLSQLRLLLGLSGSQATVQTTIEMKLTKSDTSSYGGNILEFGKPSAQTSSRNTYTSFGNRAIGNASTTTIRSDGFVRVTLKETGIYEFIIKSPSGELLASFQLNITRGMDNNSISLLVPSNVTGDIQVQILSIVQSELSSEPFLITLNMLGSIDSKIFGLGQLQTVTDGQAIHQAVVLVSVDGKSFNSIPIPGEAFKITTDPSSQTQIVYEASNIIKASTKYFFLMNRIDVSSGLAVTYGVQTDGFTINAEDVYIVTSRNSSFPKIDLSRIFEVTDRVVYAESAGAGLIEMRADGNFLREGSFNDTIVSSLYSAGSQPSPLFFFSHKGGLLYPEFFSLQSYLYSSVFLTDEYYSSYEGSPYFESATTRFYLPSLNEIFLFQSKSNGLGQFTVQISLVSSPVFAYNTITASYSVEETIPIDINPTTPVKEFGNKFAYPLYNLEQGSIGLLVGEGSSWAYSSIAPQLELTQTTDFRPAHLIENGNRLYYFYLKYIDGQRPSARVKSTDNGTTWVDYQDIIVN